MEKRIQWIDLAKGWTIFFVVLFHSVQTIQDANYFVGLPQHVSAVIRFVIGIFIMPIFFAISGFLYKKVDTWDQFWKKSINRIVGMGFPYIIFSILYVVLLNLAPGDSIHNNTSWKGVLLIGYQTISYLWFLYALLVIELLVSLMDVLKINLNIKLIISVILFIISQLITLPNGIHFAFSWLIIFVFGMIIHNYPQLYKNKKILIFESGLFILGLIIELGLSNNKNWFYSNQIYFGNLLIKLIIVPILFWVYSNISLKNKINTYFKKYGSVSLIIYLIHAPAVSIFRILLIKLGISNYVVMVITLLILSWGISVFTCWCSKKIKLIKFIFYPTKFIKLPK